jgi:hypothetical protein
MGSINLLYQNNLSLVLAQSRVAEINEAFQAQNPLNVSALVIQVFIIFFAMATAGGIYFFYRRRCLLSQFNSGELLFNELCTAHSFKRSQRRVLKKLSLSRCLNEPAMIFIDKTLWPTNQEAHRLWGNQVRQQLSDLRRHLFTSTVTRRSKPPIE